MIKKEWLQYYVDAPSNCKIVQTWDISLRDESVCMTWKQEKNACYLVDVDSKKLSYGELKEAVIGLANDYNPAAILLENDDVSTHLRTDLIGSKLPFIDCPRMPEKIWRFASLAGYIETGKVKLPKESSFIVLGFCRALLDMPYPSQYGILDAAYRFLRWAEESNKKKSKLFRW